MKYFVGVLHTNRKDLLLDVLKGLEGCGKIVLLDNSDDHELAEFINLNTDVVKPYVPMSFSQSMNFFIQLGRRRNCDIFYLCHEDIKMNNKVFESLKVRAETEQGDWGMMLTNEDAFSAYRLLGIGEQRFDTRLPDYFADTDFQYWLKVRGKEVIETKLSVFHYRSQTIQSDEKKHFINSQVYPLYAEYYKLKTGGYRGQERYKVPFNNVLFRW